MKKRNKMKKKYLLILIVVMMVGCRNRPAKLNFFQSMNQYAKVDSIKEKTILLGFDKIILKATNEKKGNIPCYQLLTSDDGLFNIKGLIWLKDSIVYINTSKAKCQDKTTDQVLFNFKRKNLAWTVYYNQENKLHYLNITNEGRYYHPQLKDSVTGFRISTESMNIFSECNGYYINASLKYGFVEFVHWNYDSIYFIDLIPKQKVLINKISNDVELK